MSKADFDSYAYEYDRHFTYSGIGTLQRNQVWSHLRSFLKKRLKIIEINCGTGEDAIRLSETGHHVLATDVSLKMIEVAKQKAQKRGAGGIIFQQSSFKDLRHYNKNSKFGLLLSNFGGLNCANETELKVMTNDLSNLLKHDGRLFLVIMGRRCKWEQFYFLLKLDVKTAFRRKLMRGVETNLGDTTFKTHYYSPAEISTIFKENFTTELVRPIGLFVPPSYLEPFFSKHRLTLRILSFIDYFFGRISFLADYADHYVIVLRKR